MKVFLVAAVFAGAVLTNVAGADPLICNEPWYTPQPHAPHPMPCHTRPPSSPPPGGQAHSQGRPQGQPPGRQEAAPSDTDFGCAFNAASDPNPEAPADTMSGEIEGGTILQNGTITCTIQVGGGTHSSANNGASASATGTNGFTALSPTVISYTAPAEFPVYLCDQFNDGTTTYYFDDTTGTWTTNAAASCRLAISVGTNDPVFDPVFDFLDSTGDVSEAVGEAATAPLADLFRNLGDPLACPALAGLAGSYGVTTINAQGDVFYLGEPFWDCPPYDLS